MVRSSFWFVIILLFMVLFLSSCSEPEFNGIVSCEGFEFLLNDAGDIVNFLEIGDLDVVGFKKSILTECRHVYLNKTFNQELCTEKSATYPNYCNLMIGYFSASPKVCFSESDEELSSCVMGFSLNENNNCSAFGRKKIDGNSLKNYCYFFKIRAGDESVCINLPEEEQENCLLVAKQGSYDFDDSCGDDVCEYPENNWNCKVDCMTIPEDVLLENPPVCGDGICEKEEDCTERLCEGGKDECFSTCPYGCWECRHVSTRNVCFSETDGGDDIYTKGIVEVAHYNDNGEDYCLTKTSSGIYANHREDCFEGTCYVHESICTEEGVFQDKFVQCPSDCVDGACVR